MTRRTFLMLPVLWATLKLRFSTPVRASGETIAHVPSNNGWTIAWGICWHIAKPPQPQAQMGMSKREFMSYTTYLPVVNK